VAAGLTNVLKLLPQNDHGAALGTFQSLQFGAMIPNMWRIWRRTWAKKAVQYLRSTVRRRAGCRKPWKWLGLLSRLDPEIG